MQRPGHKINTREPDPNPYITFTRALKKYKNEAEALHFLKAIAAVCKPVCEKLFLFVGTLEEAAYNGVFAGRNWNHGQSIELVLRRPNGQFYPRDYMVSVMAHELAHVNYMNHGPEFQKRNTEIKTMLQALMRNGYYGDGFWSDGTRLGDGRRTGADGLGAAEFPEYVCGVTKGDARSARRPRGRGPSSSRAPGLVKGEASHLSGRQTEFRRKPGARRTNVDMGESSGRLDGRREITKEDRDNRQVWVKDRTGKLMREHGIPEKKAAEMARKAFKNEFPWFDHGSTHGKQATSRAGRDERAAAIERRLNALQGINGMGDDDTLEDTKPKVEEDEAKPKIEDEHLQEEFDDFNARDSEDDVDDPHLSIQERRHEIEELSEDEKQALRGGYEDVISVCGLPTTESSAPPSPSGSPKRHKPDGPSSKRPLIIDDSDDSDPERPSRSKRVPAKEGTSLGRTPSAGDIKPHIPTNSMATKSTRRRTVGNTAPDVKPVISRTRGTPNAPHHIPSPKASTQMDAKTSRQDRQDRTTAKPTLALTPDRSDASSSIADDLRKLRQERLRAFGHLSHN